MVMRLLASVYSSEIIIIIIYRSLVSGLTIQSGGGDCGLVGSHVQRKWRTRNFDGIKVDAHLLDAERFGSEFAHVAVGVQ